MKHLRIIRSNSSVCATEKEAKGVGDIVFLKKYFTSYSSILPGRPTGKIEMETTPLKGTFLVSITWVCSTDAFMAAICNSKQADGTSGMGTYALNIMDIALEIAFIDESFEDTVTKFLKHFVLIAEFLNEHHL